MKIRKIDWGILGLLGILGVIWVSNFTPGTWLVGWDNLMPELNIWLNLKRSLFAVWQEYQGLGLVGGMGHATDLIRQIILLPFILLLPHNWIRYLWHFGMLGLGTLGIYWGLGKLGSLGKFGKRERFLAALFYLLNFGTIQIFWPPYEAFSTFWGFFPWLIFSFWQVLKKPSKKNWRFFVLINILAIPSFYIQTLFLVYLGCLGIFGMLGRKEKIKTFFKSLGVIFLVNSFWLLPFFYFLSTNLQNPRLGFSNLMASGETFLRNQKRGTIKDFLLLREYYYDFFDGEQPLMQPWQEHFSQPWVLTIGYFLGGLGALGLLGVLGKALKKKVSSFELAVSGIFLLSATALLSATPPFSYLNWLLRQSPLINQAFRAPFTKFVYPAAFSFAILFAFGLRIASSLLIKITRKLNLHESNHTNWVAKAGYGAILLLILAYSLPAFRGNFIYPQMRVKIPSQYFQLIDFFKAQPKTARIANLPQGSFWGWSFYNWKAKGSGFLWYGIEQPILDRAFDVWNLKNEQYYWELNYALQRRDPKLLENILEKYSVEFVIFDDNVIFPDEKVYAKQALKTKELLDKSQKLKKVARFGDITIYQTSFRTQPIILNNPVSSPGFKFNQFDPVFFNHKYYLSNNQNPDIFYPFADLFTNRFQNELAFQVEEKQKFWEIKKKIPAFQYDYRIFSNERKNILAGVPLSLKSQQSTGQKLLKEINISPKDLINPHLCTPQKSDSRINFETADDRIILKARNAAICVDWRRYDYLKGLKNPTIAKLEFNYLSDSDEWPQFCFWDRLNQTCLNQKDFPLQGFSQKWQKYSEKVLIDPGVNQISNLSFILDAHGSKQEKQIEYRNIKLKLYQVKNFSPRKTEKLISEIKRDKTSLSVKIPKIDSPWFVDNPIKNNLFKLEPKQCNPTLKGEYRREQLKEDGKKVIRLSATNSDSCISWHFPKLPLSLGWLIEVEYKHKTGYPLLISAFGGQEKYKFFYTKLQRGEGWKKAYFVIPSVDQFSKGITITFSNTSFNHSETVNDISSIKIIPLNWDYLKSIRLVKDNAALKPSQIKALGFNSNIWYYTVLLPKIEKGNSYLVLPQSYDNGWVAIGLEGAKPYMLRNHALVNNWANGFEIKNEKCKTKNCQIYIFFWPQILEFVGFGLMLGAIVWIARKKNN
jgi:hypothetical protein